LALTPEGFTQLRELVVDDHPDSADALAAVLELLGCPVRACYSGSTALEVAETFTPQVCLLDLRMPGIDGLELASRLTDQAADQPPLMVATTAWGDAESKSRTTQAGFHYHLVKPIDVSTLIETLTRLGEVLSRSTGPNDLPA
jgi:CheY-like chemotaxis protein